MGKLMKIIGERKKLKKELGIMGPTFAKTENLRVAAHIKRRKAEREAEERSIQKLKREMRKVEEEERQRLREERSIREMQERLRRFDEEEEKKQAATKAREAEAKNETFINDFASEFERIKKRGEGEISAAETKLKRSNLELAAKKIAKMQRLIEEGKLIGENEGLINERKRELKKAVDEYIGLSQKKTN